MTDLTDGVELLACPFCGGSDQCMNGAPSTYVQCNGCSADGPFNDDGDEAAARNAWNTRAALTAQPATSPSIDGLVEAATGLLERMSSTFKARNGRNVGIEADDGEKCWIVHSDDITALEGALAALAGEPSQAAPVEYRDERGNLIASTEPRSDVDQSVEDRMLDAIRDGHLVDADVTERVKNELLKTCRQIASDTTMLKDNERAWLSGSWDTSLPRAMEEIADHRLKTIGVQNRERASQAASPVGDEVERLRGALEPFARLARKKTWPDAPGETGPSLLDFIEGEEGTGELYVGTHFGTTRYATLWREDFGAAEAALSTEPRQSLVSDKEKGND